MAAGRNSDRFSDGVYRSPRPPIAFPDDPDLSMVPFLFLSAASHPDRLALADAASGDSLTFRQLRSSVSSAAAALSLRLNIAKGDVVLLFAPNSVHFPVCFLSVVSLGAVATTVNPAYTTAELSKQAKDSNAKLVLTTPSLSRKAAPLGLPVAYVEDIAKTPPPPPPRRLAPTPRILQSDAAALLYSSGTTGASKGVVLTHRNFICASLMLSADQDASGDGANTVLCFLPMFHVFGLSNVSYMNLRRGNTVVVMERFGSVEAMMRTVERYGVTHVPLVPPVLVALAKKGGAAAGGYDLGSLRRIGVGAAPVGADVMEEVAKIYPHVQIVQGYAMTESCGAISAELPGGAERKFGSSGVLYSGIECKVLDVETSKPLPPGQKGELCFRGPNIMRGYFNNPEATKMALDENGWLHSGDLGYLDEKGQLFVVDRIKELIKCKGFQVAPAELEGLLLAHPEILDAAVIPFPDAEAGEVPIAYVVISQNSSLTEGDIQTFVAEQVASFKRLRRVSFVKSIPKTAAGKILRRELMKTSRSKL